MNSHAKPLKEDLPTVKKHKESVLSSRKHVTMMLLTVFICLVLCAHHVLSFKIAIPMKSRHSLSKVSMVAPSAVSKDAKVKKEVNFLRFVCSNLKSRFIDHSLILCTLR